MRVSRFSSFVFACVLTGVVLCLSSCGHSHPKDEAMRAGRTAESFPAADEDYFHDMDSAIALTADEVKGRNMWIVWTGGNDKLWDTLTNTSVGRLNFQKRFRPIPVQKRPR